MKAISSLLALALLTVGQWAFAQATATSVSGTVQAQSGSAPARAVRQGDAIRAGETVSTGAGSSAVLRFEDGQIAALSANSRMTIATYTFDRATNTGTVLLSLISGGMRAVSGLIGRNSPRNVTYKAANVTIGIRGTDADVIIGPAGVVATVNEGTISFELPGQAPVIITAGEAVHARPDGTFSRGALQQIMNQLAQTPQGQQILDAINGLQGLTAMLGVAPAEGTPATGLVTTTPGLGSGSSAGGGGASAR